MTICRYGDPCCPCQDGDKCEYMTKWPILLDVQEEIFDFPPLYEEIAAVFRIHERRDIVFSFGPCLYNPHQVEIPTDIVAHEAIHGMRQGSGDDILDWWKRYMEDPTFRLVEEAHAHRVEYRWLLEHGTRRERRRALKRVAAKLASPLYGGLVTSSEARKLLKADSYEH